MAVFSWTPSWIAGILFYHTDPFSPGRAHCLLYSLYIFYLGLPIMMDTPKDKAMGYFIITIVISIIIFILIGTVSRALFGMGRKMGM